MSGEETNVAPQDQVTPTVGGFDGVVVLGAGYAGLTLALEIDRLSCHRIPVTVIDRHPIHVLRTKLFEVDRINGTGNADERWALPLSKVLTHSRVGFRQGTVQEIDLGHQTVYLDTGEISYRSLVIAVGNTDRYYGVPGAQELTESVYHLSRAQRLAQRLQAIAMESGKLPGERRARIVVVGGGITGTELAGEIATTDWSVVVRAPVKPFDVVLVTGSFPFLSGLRKPVIRHAETLLTKAGVSIIRGTSVARVEPSKVFLEDGTVLAADAVVWCAGLAPPDFVARLSSRHGGGGRIAVQETLEVPGCPGVFAIGDAAEYKDPITDVVVPATAQAAVAEAKIAATNIVRSYEGKGLLPFHYRERGVLVSVGRRKGVGRIGPITIWGGMAHLLKNAVDKTYSSAVSKGEEAPIL